MNLLLSSTVSPGLPDDISTYDDHITQHMGSWDSTEAPSTYYGADKKSEISWIPSTYPAPPRDSWTQRVTDDPLDLHDIQYSKHDDVYVTESGGLSTTASVAILLCTLVLGCTVIGCCCLKR